MSWLLSLRGVLEFWRGLDSAPAADPGPELLSLRGVLESWSFVFWVDFLQNPPRRLLNSKTPSSESNGGSWKGSEYWRTEKEFAA